LAILQEDARAKLLHHLKTSGKHHSTPGICREDIAAAAEILVEEHEPQCLSE
jgi:hypothetical protein